MRAPMTSSAIPILIRWPLPSHLCGTPIGPSILRKILYLTIALPFVHHLTSRSVKVAKFEYLVGDFALQSPEGIGVCVPIGFRYSETQRSPSHVVAVKSKPVNTQSFFNVAWNPSLPSSSLPKIVVQV